MKRIPELDAIRAVAAVLIIVFHYSYPTVLYDRLTCCFGPLALELFFVLSGYLITAIILKNGDKKSFLKSFYVRRGLRIWPVYYLIVFGYMAVLVVKPGLGHLPSWPYFVTYTQTVPTIWTGKLVEDLVYGLEPTWSLSIEEQFYIFWPMLVLFVGIGRSRRLTGFMLLVVLGSMLVRGLGVSDHTLPGRSDGFAWGGLLAVLTFSMETRRQARLSGLFISAIVLSLLVHAFGSLVTGAVFLEDLAVPLGGSRVFLFRMSPILAFGLIGLVVVHSGSRWLAPLRTRWLGNLGKISYGLYLYHLTALLFAIGLLRNLAPEAPGLVTQLLAALVALGAATASYHLIEQPFLRMKSAFEYRPARSEGVAGALDEAASPSAPRLPGLRRSGESV